METWNERLALALAESEYNQNSLSVVLKVAAPTVAAWVAAGSIKPAANINGENLLKVSRLLNIRPEWLLFREGPMRPPPKGKLSPEMQKIIETLETLDQDGGKKRDDALYFMNRLLNLGEEQAQKVG